jgi:hypothetical protein
MPGKQANKHVIKPARRSCDGNFMVESLQLKSKLKNDGLCSMHRI